MDAVHCEYVFDSGGIVLFLSRVFLFRKKHKKGETFKPQEPKSGGFPDPYEAQTGDGLQDDDPR